MDRDSGSLLERLSIFSQGVKVSVAFFLPLSTPLDPDSRHGCLTFISQIHFLGEAMGSEFIRLFLGAGSVQRKGFEDADDFFLFISSLLSVPAQVR